MTARLLAALLLLASTVPTPAAPDHASGAESDEAFFRSEVEPVLRDHCYECHSHQSGRTKGGLTLDSRRGWEAGGSHGPALVPGDPDASRLIQAVRRSDPDTAMPPDRPLPGPARSILEAWVRRGAPDPRRTPVPPDPAPAWWAVQPLVRPAVPAGPAHPIDAFVFGSPAPGSGESRPVPARADRRTRLRRLMVDLHGILPTPEEVESFVADPAPDDLAWERQIDRLLASPRYGERWARHWLDVAHFAETHGHDQDRPRDQAWPYRDYVIAAFNADTPYPRFVQEQIAADALFPESPDLIPALGFLAAGPWDESSLRDIREDVLDREIGRYLDRDDVVTSVMSTFAGVTAHCARCHDHKFDPIPQADYYALQAVFAGTEKAERVYDTDPKLNRRRTFWMRLQVALDRRDSARLDTLITPDLRADQADWERRSASATPEWRPLAVLAASSTDGVALEPLADGSLRATGTNPPTAVATLETSLDSPGITALRLEALPDETLPGRGPGRAANGNFHLTDVRVFAELDGTWHPVPLGSPSADFDQEGWDVAKALDADPQTGWGIHPREGQPHAAAFELEWHASPALAPLRTRAGVRLRIVLRQEHGRQHTLGRFRLSSTTHAPPVRVSPLPPPVAEALACAPDRRTADQKAALAAHYLSDRARRELAALPPPQRVYAGASLFPANGNQKPLGRPRTLHRLRRGEITQPLEEVEPGALSCVPGLPARFGSDPEEAARRAALARWLTDRDNPLLWRTLVNRVWHLHFGRGIAATPNDLGRMGSPPSDPRLLDWLAVTFRDDLRGSVKALHRLILTSHAWRRPSADPTGAEPLQPLRRRLDAESFRDSLLRLSGRLDLAMGGPSVRHFALSPGIHVTPKVDYAAFDPDAPGAQRRSIYRFLFRTLPDPLMDALDSPAGDQSTPQRHESFTALQAFAVLHHPFVIRHAEHFAERLRRASPDPDTQIRAAFTEVFLRPPRPGEDAAARAHAQAHGLGDLCRLLVNANEFHFVE